MIESTTQNLNSANIRNESRNNIPKPSNTMAAKLQLET